MEGRILDPQALEVVRGRATRRQNPSNMVRVFVSSTFTGQ